MVIQAVGIKSQKSRVLLKFNGKGGRWDVWVNKKIDYESAYKALVLQTEDFEETEVKDLFCIRKTWKYQIKNKKRLMRT